MSRILFCAVNYAPEPIGIAPLATDACEWLAARGHTVVAVTAMPNYPERRIQPAYRGVRRLAERRAGVHVERAWLRVQPGEGFREKAIYELSFAASSLPIVLRRVGQFDVVVAVVPTLLSTAAVSLLARLRRRARLVVWVQDLVINAASALDDDGIAARRLLRLASGVERWTVRGADRVVVCSPGFRDYFLTRGVAAAAIETIPNWVDIERIPALPRQQNGPVRFLYAGNLGYSQGFETLVDAARSTAADVRIVGGGNADARVRELASSVPTIAVQPPVPESEFPALLASADVHLVLQRGVSAGANLPSKIGPYLASGRPIVASIDSGTPAADLLRRSGAALLVPPEQPEELAAAMSALAGDPELRSRLGTAGRAFAASELARDRILPRFERALLG